MGREFELKFRATQAQLDAIAGAYGPFQTITMETTYYDTPTRALSPKKWTLRRRLENGVSVCTLKTPCPDGGRGEWETECGDILSALPALCKLGCPMELLAHAAEGFVPVCGARFTRQACQICLGDVRLELALDRGVLLGGGREIPLLEAEVELKSGSDRDARDFARELARTFGLEPEHSSKYRRALALAAAGE